MKKQKKEMKRNAGITLIALVITIIVLLMLAGASISMLAGDNGILTRAATTKEVVETTGIEEKIKLAAIGAMTNVSVTIAEDDLKSELTSYFGEEGTGYTITGSSTSGWTVTVDGVSYLITNSGSVSITEISTEVDWDTILANLEDSDARQTYLEEAWELGQDKSNWDVGIGTDGNVVNLDLWNYSTSWIGSRAIYQSASLTGASGCGGGTPSYDNSKIQEDGTIQGTIPQYIYEYGGGYICAVQDLTYAFAGCTSLTTAPAIPTTVTNMTGTFYYCTSLTTAPEIPSSVTNMSCTFFVCTSLTGTITIKSTTLSSYTNCFYNTTQPITITGTTETILNNLAGTANNSNVTVEV